MRTARRTSCRWRWRRITARTKHSPARSATSSAPRPKRCGPRNAPAISSFRSRSSWTQPSQTSAPRFETTRAFLVAGIIERISCDNGAAIPGLWQRFHQEVADIPARVGPVAYGVCCNGDDAGNFDYIAGVEVADFSELPRGFGRIRIPEQRYAVFTHADHVASIRRTVNAIWNQWLPASGLKAADAPNFERYDEKFDPATGNGGLEICIPVRD
ncbi:putative transcriptional regulator YdeE [Bradyrhizobium sp. JR1.5]